MLDDAYLGGARDGCLRTLYNLFGPPPDLYDAFDRIAHCESMAIEAAGINAATPSEPVIPQDTPLPTALPGSWT